MVSCEGHPPSDGTNQRLFRPEMLAMNTTLLLSGDQLEPPPNRELYSFSIENGCTSRFNTRLVICWGSVTASIAAEVGEVGADCAIRDKEQKIVVIRSSFTDSAVDLTGERRRIAGQGQRNPGEPGRRSFPRGRDTWGPLAWMWLSSVTPCRRGSIMAWLSCEPRPSTRSCRQRGRGSPTCNRHT